MNKNGEYVGVDEKYIPEEERYVDNTLNGEIKETIRDGVRSAKNYISKEENKEKIKNAGKKALKVGKGIAVGYIAFWVFCVSLALIAFIAIFISSFSTSNRIKKQTTETFNKIERHLDDTIDSNLN